MKRNPIRTAVAVALCTGAVATGAMAAARAGAMDGVWVAGKAESLVATGPAAPGAKAVPLYVISPVDPKHPLHPSADARAHGFGAHDHVLGANRTVYRGACDLTLVVPGPKATVGQTVDARRMLTPDGTHPLLYAARLGGTMVPLTSAARVSSAQKLRLATLVDTKTIIACRVAPRK